MSKKYLLGVDGGTEGLRAGIFDISGTPLAYASTTYTTVSYTHLRAHET